MARAPFQVAVFPYVILESGEVIYAVFRRSDGEMAWQAIAGGGEDNETPVAAANREAWEEAGIARDHVYVELDSRATIPAVAFAAFQDREDLIVIPEYSFAVEVASTDVRLSPEHTESAWLPFEAAQALLRWDNNKNALWELDCRLKRASRSLRDS